MQHKGLFHTQTVEEMKKEEVEKETFRPGQFKDEHFNDSSIYVYWVQCSRVSLFHYSDIPTFHIQLILVCTIIFSDKLDYLF